MESLLGDLKICFCTEEYWKLNKAKLTRSTANFSCICASHERYINPPAQVLPKKYIPLSDNVHHVKTLEEDWINLQILLGTPLTHLPACYRLATRTWFLIFNCFFWGGGFEKLRTSRILQTSWFFIGSALSHIAVGCHLWAAQETNSLFTLLHILCNRLDMRPKDWLALLRYKVTHTSLDLHSITGFLCISSKGVTQVVLSQN